MHTQICTYVNMRVRVREKREAGDVRGNSKKGCKRASASVSEQYTRIVHAKES